MTKEKFKIQLEKMQLEGLTKQKMAEYEVMYNILFIKRELLCQLQSAISTFMLTKFSK